MAESSPVKQIEDHLTGVRRELELFDVRRRYSTERVEWPKLQSHLRSAKEEMDAAVRLAGNAAKPAGERFGLVERLSQTANLDQLGQAEATNPSVTRRRDVVNEENQLRQIENHLTGVRRELELFDVQRKYSAEDIKWSKLQEPLKSGKQELDAAVKLADKAAADWI